MCDMFEILHYITHDAKDPYLDWSRKLRDTKARIAVDRRINRLTLGNFGDHKFCRDGVWEVRIDVGAGYRVYYAIVGQQVILLLCGGDKSSQDRDISTACKYWQDWQRRVDDEKQDA
jgi:putative addiction module killer protein